MITTNEMKRISALNGYVVLVLEESSDGILNIQVKSGADKVRLGIQESDGIYFKFIKEVKQSKREK